MAGEDNAREYEGALASCAWRMDLVASFKTDAWNARKIRDWRAGVDAKRAFLVSPATEGRRQERPFLKQVTNASIRPKARVCLAQACYGRNQTWGPMAMRAATGIPSTGD